MPHNKESCAGIKGHLTATVEWKCNAGCLGAIDELKSARLNRRLLLWGWDGERIGGESEAIIIEEAFHHINRRILRDRCEREVVQIIGARFLFKETLCCLVIGYRTRERCEAGMFAIRVEGNLRESNVRGLVLVGVCIVCVCPEESFSACAGAAGFQITDVLDHCRFLPRFRIQIIQFSDRHHSARS